MKVITKKVADLIPFVNNSRTHSDEQVAQIAASIKEFGWTNPILLDGRNGIIAGHGRLLAARKLGHAEVPCIELAHLSDAQKRAYVIADNKLALNAGWDNELLKLELTALKDLNFDLDLTGFNTDELKALLADKGTEGLTDPDAAPEPPTEPVTRLGDVWICGQHRVMCGSSLEMTAMETLCGNQRVDMLLTDPPYNVAIQGGNHGDPNRKNGLKIQNDSMSDESFRTFLRDAFVTADAVMKPGAVFYIWFADVETYNFTGALKDCGWPLRQVLIWKKSSIVMGRKDYQFKHEPCLYGWKEGAAHLWASDRKQTTVMEFDKPSRNGDHPTMKPVALFEYQMLNNTKGGDIVLDSFGGSGTTLIAAEKNGRIARIMELDPKYVDVIVKRWQEFTGQKATLESTGEPFDKPAQNQ